ncbi:hypothetical protein [Rhizobium leguminosarum]|uniref:hypothetical protein n=1 Tax=Rhizobium leguminosarum TaxID=384 RepID=UPI003CFE9BB3
MQDDDSVPCEWFGTSRAALIEKLRRLADDLENIDRQPDRISPEVTMHSWTHGKRMVPCLIGVPTGHPKIGDGKPAYSSELFYLDKERGIARTLSRWYRLGTRAAPGYWDARWLKKLGASGDSY